MQCIGACLPGVGPVVAAVIGVGLTLWSNASRGAVVAAEGLQPYIDGVSSVLEKKDVDFDPIHKAALVRIRHAAVLQAALSIADTTGAPEDQAKALKKAIEDIQKQQEGLDKFRERCKSCI